MTSSTPEEAWDLHAKLAVRFTHEYPARLIQEYRETPPAAPPKINESAPTGAGNLPPGKRRS